MLPIVVHAALTWALVGLIWTVQVVQYPLFTRVGPDSFAIFHRGHCQRMTLLVVPLVLAEAVTAGWLWWTGERRGWFLASLVLMAVNWLSSAIFQGPGHLRLLAGATPGELRRLDRSNWIRTVGWSLRGVLVGVLLAG